MIKMIATMVNECLARWIGGPLAEGIKTRRSRYVCFVLTKKVAGFTKILI